MYIEVYNSVEKLMMACSHVLRLTTNVPENKYSSIFQKWGKYTHTHTTDETILREVEGKCLKMTRFT